MNQNTKPRQVEFCGAFNGWATLLPGETVQQAGMRIESKLQAAIDSNCKKLHTAIGVDFGDISEVTNKELSK